MPALDHYLVELHRPDTGWQELQAVAARARAAAEELCCEGTPVRFLRSIFVPEDDDCFFLYEGPSVEAVRAAGQRAELAIARVEGSVQLGS